MIKIRKEEMFLKLKSLSNLLITENKNSKISIANKVKSLFPAAENITVINNSNVGDIKENDLFLHTVADTLLKENSQICIGFKTNEYYYDFLDLKKEGDYSPISHILSEPISALLELGDVHICVTIKTSSICVESIIEVSYLDNYDEYFSEYITIDSVEVNHIYKDGYFLDNEDIIKSVKKDLKAIENSYISGSKTLTEIINEIELLKDKYTDKDVVNLLESKKGVYNKMIGLEDLLD